MQMFECALMDLISKPKGSPIDLAIMDPTETQHSVHGLQQPDLKPLYVYSLVISQAFHIC